MAVKVKNFSSEVQFGKPQKKGSLTIYPIFAPGSRDQQESVSKPPDYLLLEEVLGFSTFEIGEVNEAGDVNTVIINNMTDHPVLILDGEEITGAKQNRMVNATILVAAGRKTAVPVSCVEQGRWRYDTDKFQHSDTFGYSTLRRQKAEQVQNNLRQKQGFAADQGAIWSEIEKCDAALHTDSPTAALGDTYRSRASELEDMIKDLDHQPNQIGIAVYIKNRFTCLDLFNDSETLAKLWTRLLKSYAVEALTARGRSLKEPRPTPASLIKKIGESEYLTYSSVSLGHDLRLTGTDIVGAGLLVDETIIHLSVFPREAEETAPGDITTPRRRRRNIY